MTKNEMAKLIVMVLYNEDELPASDDPQVIRAARNSVKELEYLYECSLKVLARKSK